MNIQAMPMEAVATASTSDATAQLVDHYRAASDGLPGTRVPWLRKRREAAIAVIAERGLPHRRIEEWKYTDLRAMMTEAYPQAAAAVEPSRAALDTVLGALADIGAARVVFVNGRRSAALSDVNGVPSGVELRALAEVLAASPDWLRALLGRVNAQPGETVAALNEAFMTDGAALRIAPGARLADPVHVVHVSAGDRPHGAALRNVIEVGAGAEVTLVESFVSLGDAAAQTFAVTELVVADGARVRHVKLLDENAGSLHLGNWHVRLGAGVDYSAVQVVTGGGVSRSQAFVRYEGQGTRAHFDAAQCLRGRQHCDMTLLIDHAVPGCESRELVKSVLEDSARGVFQAKVMVRRDAQKTDGRQMAQALLLSERAEFDSKPELEIYADDVKCNHGSTTGALNEDLLFYLRARGVPAEEARALLITAFIGEVLDKVEHEGLHEALAGRVADWLAGNR